MLDRWRPWLALAIVLILIAYGPSLAHLIAAPRSTHRASGSGEPGRLRRGADDFASGPPDLAAFLSRDPSPSWAPRVTRRRSAEASSPICARRGSRGDWPVNSRGEIVRDCRNRFAPRDRWPGRPRRDRGAGARRPPGPEGMCRQGGAGRRRDFRRIPGGGGTQVGHAGRVRAWLRGQPIRVLGPNCLGWIRPRAGSTLRSPRHAPRGGIAFLSHSGALASAILTGPVPDVGFSFFATLGNQAD